MYRHFLSNNTFWTIFSGADSAHCCAAYGAGSKQIFIDDLSCPPGAINLTQCTHRGWGINNCDHSEDAGVVCTLGKIISINVAC